MTIVGRFNSSITRVRPFFRALFERDQTGAAWLASFLSACPDGSRIANGVRASPGTLEASLTQPRPFKDRIQGEIELARAFEFSVPPPSAFLRYLIETPSRLTWPLVNGQRKTFGADTQRQRTLLIDGTREEREATRRAALLELERDGASGSAMKWWAFEGFTEVDCLLSTNEIVIFVEGKRNEHLSESTEWFDGRNQLVRNCEAIGEIAGARSCGVVVVGENELDTPSEAGFETGLPHLSGQQRDVVRQRFLGQTTWRRLCDAMSVPFESLPYERAGT